jgi:RimK family alpha-L-glutamate ligase
VRIAIIAHTASRTNLGLASAAPPGLHAVVVDPDGAVKELRRGSAALGRLDVLHTVDGIEPGLGALELLEARGVTVLNSATALRLAHDKLATAVALGSANIPHPTTRLVDRVGRAPLPFPLVLKPRFGSWGRDVVMCSDAHEYEHALRTLASRPWFGITGAVVQDLVPPLGHDLRVLVSCGEVVGAVRRVAAPGEWRTNVALGATREPVEPSPAACELAQASAAALRADLVGVDLLPVAPGCFVVIEVNGAVDFGPEYAPAGDVYAHAMRALTRKLHHRGAHQALTAVA